MAAERDCFPELPPHLSPHSSSSNSSENGSCLDFKPVRSGDSAGNSPTFGSSLHSSPSLLSAAVRADCSNSKQACCHSSGSSDSGIASPSSTPNISPVVAGRDTSFSCNGITVTLLETDMWNAFKAVGNEMIVTKPGRRLFPSLLVGVRGLDHHTDYSIYLRVTPVDEFRYKFLDMRWVAVGESETRQDENRQIYKHPNSPKTGAFWMKKPISFKPCKITHNPASKHGNILLHTMHKYMLTIIVCRANQCLADAPAINLTSTEFIAVSSYQNTALTQLKIDNNPFAKGFRDRDIMPSASSSMYGTFSGAWENGLSQPLPDISRSIESPPDPHPSYRPTLPLFTSPFSALPPVPISDRQQVQVPTPLRPLQLPYPYQSFPVPPPLMSLSEGAAAVCRRAAGQNHNHSE